jgi:gamma-glutamylcyclotransferase (GGCT)/AIG2-like uncharacterized protein YtfP
MAKASPNRFRRKPFDLFVYGTLMDPRVFRAVLGRDLVTDPEQADGVSAFLASEAVLDGHKKISPDDTYLYAAPDPQGRIRGLLIRGLPRSSMKALEEYEGNNYRRKKLPVTTRDGETRAWVFVGKSEQLEHSFGYQFDDPLKQEILLERKIEAALLEAERDQLNTTESTARRAVGELHGSVIRDLIRNHFEKGGISDYAIRTTLKETPLRDFSRILGDPEAEALAPNYLSMVIRQVIFNQFEERIHTEFRYELDHMGLSKKYYDRTVSSLVALRILNASTELLEMLVGDCLNDLDFHRDHLVDFVRWSIVAADAIYDPRTIKQHLGFVASHSGGGYIPIGAELEFSNIGHGVIRDPAGQAVRDLRYDGFLYFPDFGLDVLTWKLGGHIDDHHDKHSDRPRRGFFEVALGNLSIEANLSKPITDDPWLLNQLLQQVRRFFQISPHSVHLSLQLPRQHRPVRNRMLPIQAIKCLFAIGGDPVRDEEGQVRISRLNAAEIVGDDPCPSVMFSEISKRFSQQAPDYLPGAGKDRGKYVQQYRFLRLSSEINYEPIAMALKGLQISRRPGTFLTPDQYDKSAKHREALDELLRWGRRPTPLSKEEREVFLGSVYEGLITEKRGKPAHSEAYIAWAMEELREAMEKFNQLVATFSQPSD